jgi:allantoicase
VVILKLAVPGAIGRILVDTGHFKGNYPDSCSLEGCKTENDADVIHGAIDWSTILPQQKLAADREHEFSAEIISKLTYSHVRLNIFPDGGISRLRLFGKKKNQV